MEQNQIDSQALIITKSLFYIMNSIVASWVSFFMYSTCSCTLNIAYILVKNNDHLILCTKIKSSWSAELSEKYMIFHEIMNAPFAHETLLVCAAISGQICFADFHSFIEFAVCSGTQALCLVAAAIDKLPWGGWWRGETHLTNEIPCTVSEHNTITPWWTARLHVRCAIFHVFTEGVTGKEQ